MKVLELERLEVKRRIDAFGSEGFDALGFVRSGRVTLARVRPGGRIGGHEVPVEQLFIVVSGSAEVESGEQTIVLGAGDAVCFAVREDHRTTSESGFLAVVVESPDVRALFSDGE